MSDEKKTFGMLAQYETAEQIFMGGAYLYDFNEEHFAKAAAAAERQSAAAAD